MKHSIYIRYYCYPYGFHYGYIIIVCIGILFVKMFMLGTIIGTITIITFILVAIFSLIPLRLF